MTLLRPFLLLAASLLALLPLQATARTEITLMRFFGTCDAKYAKVVDARQAVGECGIITALVNEFNATNKSGIVVKTQVAEWGPYYDQLTARLVAKDAPTVSVMHESLLGDYVRRKLVEPLDAGFKEAGIDSADFTDHARRGVTFDGVSYALPFDTWSWLWHFNMNLMKKAGLAKPDGSPVLPRSPDELLEHARKFKAATGKPYFAWAVANESAALSRTFLTLVYQQNGKLFADDGRSINLQGKEARAALELMQKLYLEGHIKPNTDYAAANQAYLNGDAGVLIVGTWTIDQFMADASAKTSPLHGGYWVSSFPQLFARQAAYADGHAWVLMKGGAANEAQRKAALELMKFLYDRNLEWSRTGHLSTSRKVTASAEFKALPYRAGIAEITQTGISIPSNVPIQRMVESLLGEDISNLLISKRPVQDIQNNIERRINAALKKAPR